MTTALLVTLLVFAAAIGIALFCAGRAAAANAKSEVYAEFAATFDELKQVQLGPREIRRARSRQAYLRLALIDPAIRDGLRDALRDADEHWGAPETDGEFSTRERETL